MAQLQRREVLAQLFDAGELQGEYADYLMKHSDKPIYNGDMLLTFMEEGYLAFEFLTQLENQ